MQIKDRVVVVSGGASGLCEAYAPIFAKAGARIGILYLN